jgi:hypothetical protein
MRMRVQTLVCIQGGMFKNGIYWYNPRTIGGLRALNEVVVVMLRFRER